ncbi:MAG: hypothetical protein JO112_18095 [Planctomycetes bacterium]|nr:hypothetical protein [Planctomycetota bacterium]
MLRTLRWALPALLLAGASALAADAPYSVKTAAVPAPKELKPAIAGLLSDQAVQFLDAKGKVLAEIWLCKQLPMQATAEQAKSGLAYEDVPETTLFGAIRFPEPITDFRKQTIKAGVYTLRLGLQPMDGDHMGTAPYQTFLLVAPAALDEKPDVFQNSKDLYDLSAKAVGATHPGVFLLIPNPKPEDQPKVVAGEGSGTWVVQMKEEAKAGDQKAVLGIGLTLVGVSPSAE